MKNEKFEQDIDSCNNLRNENLAQTDQKLSSKKNNRKAFSYTLAFVFFISFLLFSTTSCVVVSPKHHDSGKHKGWFKSSKQPHNTYIYNDYQKEDKSKGKKKKH